MDPAEFKEIVERELSSLRNQGYLFSGPYVKSEKLLGDSIQMKVVNKECERSINVKLFFNGAAEQKEVLFVRVEHLNPPPLEWDDYTSTGAMAVDCPKLSKLSGPLKHRVVFCLQQVMQTLNSTFKLVLKGREFKSDHIDWGGLK